MITHLGPSGTQRLLDIFNQSWKSGRLPHEWKRATIIPIRKPAAAAFLDLSKAFDTVWRNKLILKMFDVFGIKGKALPWISDFLKYRVIRVKYNKTLSKDFKLSQGVPQGSVVSPTLFSMFLAGVEKLFTENSSIGLFADDIVLWHSSHDIPSIEANLS
ncbi:putative RNA-directed DNA polymerase from transposon BS [Trichonephila clavipes]|nr:putative RNA-directed DNA polymerase from transposon BS [Trichonephila clavipes]